MNSAQQQPVRLRVFFSSLNFEFTFVHYTLSTTVCSCTLPKEQVSPVRQILFLWGHGPDTLACKARPSSDQCGTSLSVSLSLSFVICFGLGAPPDHVLWQGGGREQCNSCSQLAPKDVGRGEPLSDIDHRLVVVRVSVPVVSPGDSQCPKVEHVRRSVIRS